MLKFWVTILWILLSTVPICRASQSVWMLRIHPQEFRTLLPEIQKLTNLRGIDLSGSEYEQIKSVIEDIAGLNQLEALDLGGTGLLVVPHPIISLTRLKQLNLARNQIKTLPSKFCHSLKYLKELNLSGNVLEELPVEIGELQHLVRLDLKANQIKALPDSLWQLILLENLDLSKNSLSLLPNDIGRLTDIKHLDLSGNKLTTLPQELAHLSALERLDISWNQFKLVPEHLSVLPRLTCLEYDFNPLVEPPKSSWLQKVTNCTTERIQILLTAPATPRIEPNVGDLESKSILLLAFIKEFIEKEIKSKISVEEFLRYEAEHRIDSAQRQLENRLTFFNFLLDPLNSGTPEDSGGLLNDYTTYSARNWIAMRESKQNAEVPFLKNHHQKVFEWQLSSSKIIFWVVIVIVVTGLVFSGVQFFASLKIATLLQSRDTPERQGGSTASQDRTEIEISLQAIKVKTSLIGVVILAMSLVFFYLYLKYVYPINAIKLTN